MTPAATTATTELTADPARVVARLFLPGEGVPSTHSRAARIVERVLALPPAQTAALAQHLLADFQHRHVDTVAILQANARAVGSRVPGAVPVSGDQAVVLGASFTAEYAIEGAALCNPSAMEHPDQSGLDAGQYRVAVALRAIGEGHLSSIEFAEAVIGPGERWAFTERAAPPATATIGPGRWRSEHLRAAIEHEQQLTELSSATLDALPAAFTSDEVEQSIRSLPPELLHHRDSGPALQALREVVESAYTAEFDGATALAQRVLLPVAAEEDHGMEDARFVRFTHDDGTLEYRATYTAYDGRDIAPRLVTSTDLRRFAVHRLSGAAARNKGMALFPRPVHGAHLALARTDGERISLARSDDGMTWRDETTIHEPIEPWEIVQTGNCGSPLETPRGWLVLTHGVGPLRVYSIGALLLDLDDPAKVLARTTRPFLQPDASTRDGYVPNVVYSCGGIIRDGTLWLPYGIGDARIAVFSIGVDQLIDSLEPAAGPSGAAKTSRQRSASGAVISARQSAGEIVARLRLRRRDLLRGSTRVAPTPRASGVIRL